MASRKSAVESMKATRALFVLDSMSGPAKKQVIHDGIVAKPIREALDKIFENVFSTVAFQTALVCTYVEAIQIAFEGIQHSTQELLDEYIEAINGLLRPKTISDLKALMHAFEGELAVEPEVKLTSGGPTFRQVVIPAEMQPAEWPKYRYLLLELWKPAAPELQKVLDVDRARARADVAQALYRRRLKVYCEDNRIDESDLTKAVKSEIMAKAKAMYEEFLSSVAGRKVVLEKILFEPSTPGGSLPSSDVTDGIEINEND